MTAANLATLAVSANDIAVALASADSRIAHRLVRGVEIAGAGAVLLLGLSLLGGALSLGLTG